MFFFLDISKFYLFFNFVFNFAAKIVYITEILALSHCLSFIVLNGRNREGEKEEGVTEHVYIS